MGLELSPTERRYIPAAIIAGAGLSLVKLGSRAAGKVGAGEALTAADYGLAILTCVLIYAAVWFKRHNRP